ncbi:MAG TPA: hypothetical protein PLJ84_06955 [Bacteroidales bacterium]|nr:hypothetical protein [Bacteroidales bacterium]
MVIRNQQVRLYRRRFRKIAGEAGGGPMACRLTHNLAQAGKLLAVSY